VKFKYKGVTLLNPNRPMPPNYIVVFPASGTTSETDALIGLNENVIRTMSPGNYSLYATFSTVDQSPPSEALVAVFLTLSAPRGAAIISVVNAASRQPQVAPGSTVSILGTGFGPPLGTTQYDDTALYPTAIPDGAESFGNTTVTFNGEAAPLLYLSSNQIDVMAPSSLTGRQTADVVVTCYAQSTKPFTVAVQDVAPGIFTADGSGSGQGAISNVESATYTILPGADGADIVFPIRVSPNSSFKPAPKGSLISVLATGGGSWDPPVPDGAVAPITTSTCHGKGNPQCRNLAAAPVSLTIGGKRARVIYTGAGPYQPWSVVQIYAFVPEDADSGAQPVVLTIGNNGSSQQNVTVAVE
jgi:uncharacterized protein (TIGR03437 family)